MTPKRTAPKNTQKVVIETTYAQKPVTKSPVLARAKIKQAELDELDKMGTVAPEPKSPKVTKSDPKSPKSDWTPERRAAFHQKMVDARAAKKGVAPAKSTKPPKSTPITPVPTKSMPITIVAPENRVRDLEYQVKLLGAKVEQLNDVVGKFQKFLSYLSTFDSNALRVEPTESTNSVQTGSKKSNSTETKKVLTPEQKSIVRARFVKGQHKAAARRLAEQNGKEFDETRWEKGYDKSLPK